MAKSFFGFNSNFFFLFGKLSVWCNAIYADSRDLAGLGDRVLHMPRHLSYAAITNRPLTSGLKLVRSYMGSW